MSRFLSLVFFICFGPMALQAQAPIQAYLLEQLGRGQAPMIVVLREQADLSAIPPRAGKQEKGRLCFEALRQTAARSQQRLRALCTSHQAAFRSFPIANSLYVKGDVSLAREIAALPEVRYILADATLHMEAPVRVAELTRRDGELPYGLTMVGADQVWALGFRGQGVVIGGQDTGYEWGHPALKHAYRGWDGVAENHNYNWHDAIHEINPAHDSLEANPCGVNSPFPCDDNNHGTHTMGTMVGDDGADHQIGMAPQARWIAARNMERGIGTVSTYLEAFYWLLAPTDLSGNNPRPDLAPHVINNSWYCSEEEGCSLETNALFEEAVNALRAAGIFVVVSAGNAGPDCASLAYAPAIMDGAFTVAATNEIDSVASYSSRGAVEADGSFRMKPDISAPGSAVLSSVRGGEYQHFWGTSMAGPHVAGLVALIISAVPELAGQIDILEEIIRASAVIKLDTQDCSGSSGQLVPNPSYGFGRINALAAVQLAASYSTVQEPKALQALLVPNPFEGSFEISAPIALGDAHFQLYDLQGRLLYSKMMQMQANVPVSLEPRQLPAGLYVYRLSADRYSFSGKIVRK